MLTDLSPPLVGQILSYESTTHAALRLWQCGSRALQTQLIAGVFKVELRNSKELILLQMPKCLAELRNLRFLTVDRSQHVLYNPSRTFEVLKSLSPSLEKLTLRFKGAGFFFNPCSPSERLTGGQFETWNPKQAEFPDNAFIDSQAAFPSLQSLKLDEIALLDATALQGLPRSLLSLSAATTEKGDSFLQCIKALPPNLTSFSTFGRWKKAPSFCSALPRTLTKLAIPQGTLANVEELSNLPRELKVLRTAPFRWTIEQLSALPPLIKDASIVLLPAHDDCYLAISALPKSLTRLDMQNTFKAEFNAVRLRALPPTLTSLNGVISFESVATSDFPRSLTSLVIDGGVREFTKEFARLLPPFLRSLTLSGYGITMELDVISHLPEYLTSLSAKVDELSPGANLIFPRGLTFLSLDVSLDVPFTMALQNARLDYGEEGSTEALAADGSAAAPPDRAGFCHLPLSFFKQLHVCAHLKTLLLKGALCPLSALQFLSPHLERLLIRQFVKDAAFNLEESWVESKVQSLFAEAAFSVCKEELTSQRPPALPRHWFDLIPRKMVLLEASYPFLHTHDLQDWTRLPKAMTNLKLNCPLPLDNQVLRYLPMAEMNYLEIKIDPMDDEAVKHLGRKMKQFDSLGDEWDPEESTVKYCTPGLILGDGTNDSLAEMIQVLDEERTEALHGPFSPDAFKLFEVLAPGDVCEEDGEADGNEEEMAEGDEEEGEED